MRCLFILILAMFAFAAPIPALATQAMCAQAMPQMASMADDAGSPDHGKKGSCCDEKHKACLQACEAMCVVALAVPAPVPVARTADAGIRPLPRLASFTIVKPARGLDPPPRTVV